MNIAEFLIFLMIFLIGSFSTLVIIVLVAHGG